MLTSNLTDSPDTRQRIAAQVLRTIVDEKLQMQEAKRQNITATDEEINKALGQIEKQNNMQPGQLVQLLKAHGIDRSALVEQLTASIVWAKLVRRLLSQTSIVSDEEIDYALKRAKETANEPQSRVAEIFLAVDNPQQEDDVRRLAERLTEQMKQGARFSAVAQQFSQSATAAVGGDIGWVRAEQLSPELGKAVAQMRPGELSPPIRTGCRLLFAARARQALGPGARPGRFAAAPGANRVSVAAAGDRSAAPCCYPRGAERQDVRKELRGAAENRQGEGLAAAVERGAPAGRPDRPRDAQHRAGAGSRAGLAADRAKERRRRDHGVREGGGPSAPTIPTRDEIGETLMRQRLDTLARRYMRDLRRTAFVDLRV